jgi:hypothetical protein
MFGESSLDPLWVFEYPELFLGVATNVDKRRQNSGGAGIEGNRVRKTQIL